MISIMDLTVIMTTSNITRNKNPMAVKIDSGLLALLGFASESFAF